MRKIASILILFLIVGCQKQIQLSNGKVIYQPYGKTETIQSSQNNNNSQDASNSANNGMNGLLNATGSLVAPATAGAVVASDSIGNTSGDGIIDNQPTNTAQNTYGNVENNNLENAVNNSFGGKVQESALINNGSFGGQTKSQPTSQAVNTSNNTPSYTQTAKTAQSYTPSATTNASPSTTSAVSNVAQTTPQNYTLQVGNYANANTANKIASNLKAKGYNAQVVKSGATNKVVVGDYITKASGNATKAELTALGYAGTFFTTLGEE